MRIPVLISLSLLLLGCDVSSVHDEACEERDIPVVYTLYNEGDDIFHGDTLYHQNKKYSGYLYALYPSTSDTAALIAYYNGLQSGISKKWYSAKKLMEVRYYCAGQKNGKQISYWENGNKRFEFTAVNDAYEGKMEEWDVNGHLFHLAHFVNGQEEGEQKLWYDNGKIRANYVVRKGKRYGLLGTKNCTNVSDSIFTVK
ncbi:toxin-antitoxin system YwqK family antitoxin [Cytophaga aurantiaca]|uniref:toxin-antitoxin system YwqK family antitoxin n=1 Tax=Cytophaga aurantiaca TaxID=29530 RepID=UPI000364862B|nr:hypothetical protein [Cytophaga aurantiaca]